MSKTRNIRISEETYQELFKLKSLLQAMRGKNITYDEVIGEMVGLYQSLVKGTKIVKENSAKSI
jgi:predicted CopG family antitoxin